MAICGLRRIGREEGVRLIGDRVPLNASPLSFLFLLSFHSPETHVETIEIGQGRQQCWHWVSFLFPEIEVQDLLNDILLVSIPTPNISCQILLLLILLLHDLLVQLGLPVQYVCHFFVVNLV